MTSISLLALATSATIVAITVAGYERKQIIQDPTQSSTNLQISAEGTRLTNYYLDPDIWKTASDSYNSYWALVFEDNGGTPTTLKYIHGIADGDNYRFSINTALYDKVQFFRTSSTNDSTLESSTNYTHSYYNDSGGFAVNSIDQVSFVSGKTTYQVTGWNGGTGVDGKNSYGFWR